MKTRIGKIARLPRTLRDPLNQRLHDGEPGHRLLAWLNSLPEVQAVLAAEFESRPINAQNLSDWKQGGYRDWVAQQEALELAQRLGEDAAELQADGRPPLTDTLALWLAARYAVATRQVSQAEGAKGWRALRELCADVVELRRGDHSAERLRLEREHLAATRYRQHEERVKELWEWSQQPKIREFLKRDDHDNTAIIQALGKLMFGETFMVLAKGFPEPDAGQGGSEGAAGPEAVPPSSPTADADQGESR